MLSYLNRRLNALPYQISSLEQLSTINFNDELNQCHKDFHSFWYIQTRLLYQICGCLLQMEMVVIKYLTWWQYSVFLWCCSLCDISRFRYDGYQRKLVSASGYFLQTLFALILALTKILLFGYLISIILTGHDSKYFALVFSLVLIIIWFLIGENLNLFRAFGSMGPLRAYLNPFYTFYGFLR